MEIVKVIEVSASSEKEIEDAIQQCVIKVSKTKRNIDSVDMNDTKVHVKNGKIVSFGVICKVSFHVSAG